MNRETPTPDSERLQLNSAEKGRAMQEVIDQDELLNKRVQNLNQDDDEISETEKRLLMQRRKTNPLFQGCNSIENYIYLNKIHEGSYGIVFRAKDKITQKQYAIKNIKVERSSAG